MQATNYFELESSSFLENSQPRMSGSNGAKRNSAMLQQETAGIPKWSPET
jgi:hypothetical protein